MKRPHTVSQWIGVAVAIAGCAAAVWLFGYGLGPAPDPGTTPHAPVPRLRGCVSRLSAGSGEATMNSTAWMVLFGIGNLIAGFWLGLKAAAWVVRKHMETDQ